MVEGKWEWEVSTWRKEGKQRASGMREKGKADRQTCDGKVGQNHAVWWLAVRNDVGQETRQEPHLIPGSLGPGLHFQQKRESWPIFPYPTIRSLLLSYLL